MGSTDTLFFYCPMGGLQHVVHGLTGSAGLTQVLQNVCKVVELLSCKHERRHVKVWIPLIKWKI